MKNRDIMDAMNGIDFDMIEDAGRVTRKTSLRRKVTRWSSLAACVCVVLVGALLLFPLLPELFSVALPLGFALGVLGPAVLSPPQAANDSVSRTSVRNRDRIFTCVFMVFPP